MDVEDDFDPDEDTSEPVSVYLVEGGWVVADHGMWLPGCYDSEETARAAVGFSDSVLAKAEPICSIYGENRNITLDDLRRVEKELESHD